VSTDPGAPRRQSLAVGLLSAVSLVLLLASTHRPVAAGSHVSNAAPIPEALRSPVAAAVNGRPGREVDVLAAVEVPSAGGCVHVRIPGSALTYRLVGDTARRWTATPRRTTEVWWLTGHALPRTETAGHTGMAPNDPRCPGPAFWLDSARSLSGWLSDLLHALLPSALPPTVTAAPPSRVVHQI
jgi:hypothetical protein